MNLLKRYYDKAILLVLFIFFVVLMFSVLSIIDQTGAVTQKDLELPTRVPNHTSAEASDAKFDIEKLWKERALNWESGAKGADKETVSDLVKAEKLAVCPYCSERAGNTKVLIPFSSFGAKCPNEDCGKDLPVPHDAQAALVITANDTDGDGISNEDEKKYGLNPDDENDANYDLDGDGFSNRYEIITAKTSPNNSKDHPPLWHRLYIAGVRKVELPIKLMVVNTNNNPDKSKWDIQYNLPRTRRNQVRITSNFVALGDEIQVDENDKRMYKIVDVRHVETAGNKNVQAAAEDKNEESSNVGKFAVRLREVVEDERFVPDEFEMVTGEPVYSSDLRPIFQDSGIPGSAPLVRRIGSDIIIYREVAQQNVTSRYIQRQNERYRVLKVDHKTQHVTLGKVAGVVEDESQLETVVITPEGQVPAGDRVKEGKSNENTTPDAE